jgi:hypothetical protein
MRWRYAADMPVVALLPLLITAGVVALVLLWPRVRSGPGAPRLAAEVVVTTLALSALLIGLTWAAQRLPW